jgi:hypothetical protein
MAVHPFKAIELTCIGGKYAAYVSRYPTALPTKAKGYKLRTIVTINIRWWWNTGEYIRHTLTDMKKMTEQNTI